MGAANCKVINDTGMTLTINAYSYADGIRLCPTTIKRMKPKDEYQFTALAHGSGLIISNGSFNKGRHYHARNGEIVYVSQVLAAPGNSWAMGLSIMTGVLGGLGGAIGGVALVPVLAPIMAPVAAAVGAGVAGEATAVAASYTCANIIAGGTLGAAVGAAPAGAITVKLGIKELFGHPKMAP